VYYQDVQGRSPEEVEARCRERHLRLLACAWNPDGLYHGVAILDEDASPTQLPLDPHQV
jgi:hypothetical protein